MGGVGAFGKIAGLGDFLRRDLPPGFTAAWDEWLARGILESRAALGPRWDEAYRVAPIWRFALGPGLAGRQAAAGVLMPSQDRVGRSFPLTLVAALPAEEVETALEDEVAMQEMEEVALRTLDSARGSAALIADLARISPPRGRPGPALRGSLWRAWLGERAVECRFPALPPAAAFIRLIDPDAEAAA
ncbi:MAG: type VI secretion-associated protein [Paracoccaceae bacterium]|nr:MAG: type VI secretion system-associated protein TagF [Alphaproteobacteria bacterium]GIX12583.1 MAG: type VI secretion-associated protein [Paracoccaceae bacterium]